MPTMLPSTRGLGPRTQRVLVGLDLVLWSALWVKIGLIIGSGS